MNLIFFDIETGGLEMTHPIIQIAAIAVDEEFAELDSIELKLRFDPMKADPEALKINHYDTLVWVSEAIEQADAVRRLAKFIEPHKAIEMVSKKPPFRPYKVACLAGHNAATFDGPRLQRLFRDHKAFLPADPRVLCTVQLAMWWALRHGVRPKSFKLGDLCEHFGIPIAAGEAHDALADVRLTIELTKKLTEAVA